MPQSLISILENFNGGPTHSLIKMLVALLVSISTAFQWQWWHSGTHSPPTFEVRSLNPDAIYVGKLVVVYQRKPVYGTEP